MLVNALSIDKVVISGQYYSIKHYLPRSQYTLQTFHLIKTARHQTCL